MSKTATYKGRTYKLLFSGKTKFGNKAKLGFMDGSKEFWVDLGLITEGSSEVSRTRPNSVRTTRLRTCPRCGGNEQNQIDCGECA